MSYCPTVGDNVVVTCCQHTEVKPNVILRCHRLGTEVRPEHHVGVAFKVGLNN